MSKSISEIKKEFQEAYKIFEQQNGNSDLIDNMCLKYINDQRSGVKACILQVKKKKEKLADEKVRTEKMYYYEKMHREASYICGIDEAGRGPLAGPVIAAAVVLPADKHILWLNDSKKLSASKRESLYDVICREAVAYGIGMASPARIDEINILQATYEAMREAICALGILPDLLLNDAVTIPNVDAKQIPIIKGDAKSASIAAASILAKVKRDRLMEEYDSVIPGYSFGKHKGYGTREHIEVLKKIGPSPIHRRTFIGHFLGDFQ